jgi:RNA polymerase sigma-70 factor (ECF subfamily)
MRYWMSESIREIARRTGSSEGKIKMMLMRTRKKLADKLKKEGFTL